MKRIDVNSDVGEGVGNEAELMPLISSCNIACGGHAGDEATMRETIRLAIKHHVKIGAHPSYPDRANFGRKIMDISSDDLTFSLGEQLSIFSNILEKEGGELHHIKPHGALYNAIAKDEKLANTFLDAISEYIDVPIYVPFTSVIEREAKSRNFRIIHEAFADRNYHHDLSLVSRKEENAVMESPQEVLAHIVRMVNTGEVLTLEGSKKKILAHTFCVHGDTPSALEILMYLHKELLNHNIQIKR